MNLLYLLRHARDVHRNDPAILHGDWKPTWGEFYARVEQSASYLAGAGFQPTDRVALLLSNSPEYLELLYSTTMAGIAVVPLNNRWGIEEFAFSLADSGSKALLFDHRYAAMAEQIHTRVPAVRLIPVEEYRAGVDSTEPRTFSEPAPEDLAGLFYTSGTTGGPKGVMLTQRNLYSNAILLRAAGADLGRVYLHAAPMFHLADGAATHLTTMTGAAHTFLEVFDAGEFLSAIPRYRITSSLIVPTMVNLIVNHPAVDAADLTSLENIVYGASPMPLALLKKAMEKLKCRFTQGYGMTELSPVVSVLLPEHHVFDNLDRTFAPVRSAGRPVAGMEVRVVDVNDCDVPQGEVGEIIARGDNVMKGYWKRPEINAEVLRGGWMHTGDMGAFDEQGFLYILDRMKDMIKTGSENVYSPEVESVIVAHDAVLEAAIIGVPDERWGETIRAIVVLHPGATLTATALIDYCRGRMAHFKCQTSVVFVDALPKGGTGKVQKSLLRKRFGSASVATA